MRRLAPRHFRSRLTTIRPCEMRHVNERIGDLHRLRSPSATSGKPICTGDVSRHEDGAGYMLDRRQLKTVFRSSRPCWMSDSSGRVDLLGHFHAPLFRRQTRPV